MNKTAIIHLGMHKTGTSSIQNWLFNNRDLLQDHGIEYPLLGLSVSEPEVGIRHNRLVFGDEWKNNCEQVVDDIKASHFRRYVLSAEAWSRPTTSTKLDFLLATLRSNGIRVTGILYLRNYFKFIRSYYRECCLRRNNHKPFPEFFLDYRNGLFNYQKVASNLSSLFNGDIVFRNFDEINDVTSDFLERVAPILPKASSQKFNSGIGPLEAEIARIINSQALKVSLTQADGTIRDQLGLSEQQIVENYIESTDFIDRPTIAYKKKLGRELSWSCSEIEKLFAPNREDVQRQDISSISEDIRLILSEM